MKTAEFRSAPAILASLLLGLAACSPATSESGVETSLAPDTGVAPTTLTALDPARLAERADPSDFCSLDTVDGQLFVQDPINRVANPAAVRFTGWVGDAGSLSRPVSPVLRIASADRSRGWVIALGAPVERADVAAHYDAATMQASGFDFPVDLSALPAGEYNLALGYLSSGRPVLCDTGRRVVVGG